MTQREALDILKLGKNVFLTGSAGSGKTYVLNEYIKYLKNHHVPIGITASTGIAATHMGGVTIHSWSGISVKDSLTSEDIREIAEKKYIRDKVKEAKVLIIDEVSMLHHFRLDMINRVIKHIRENKEPFGGLQVVICGDFFQLPPVARFGEPEAQFIYNSNAWKEAKFIVCYLEENFRHGNDDIIHLLNEIRSGTVGEKSEEIIGRRSNVESEEKTDIEPTLLFTHNVDVDRINDEELKKIKGLEVIHEMYSKGRKYIVDLLKKSCLAPENLKLKKGARVMCVKNNFDVGYVNGTLGVVVSCAPDSDPIIRTMRTPDYPEGQLLTIERATWTIEEDGRTLARIEQYPLRLAWAITVHKSQGMSLDAIEVDLSKTFEPGMGYVALSRVRSLAGLKITGINEMALEVNREVLEYDKHLKELSERAERLFEYTDRREIEKSQLQFLSKVAGKSGGKSVRKKKERSSYW